MQVDFQGVVARLSDLDQGAFFALHDGEKPLYGMAALFSGEPCAILFDGASAPRLVPGADLAHASLLAIAGAVARPSLAADSVVAASFAKAGAMTVAGSGVYLRVAKADGTPCDVSLSTGTVSPPPTGDHAIHVSRWSIVRPLHGEFETLVRWPA